MEVDRKTYAGIFFDLDDTLIEGYIHPPQPYGRVVPLPGRVDMLAELRRAGIKLGIASNQGGVAFGYNTRAQAEQKRLDVLATLDLWGRGVPLLMAFAHPDAPTPPDDFYEYRRRKPNPGMLLELAEHFKLSPDDCLFVGDRPEDQQASENAGMEFCHAESFFADGYGLTLARVESMPIRPATLDRYMASAPWVDHGDDHSKMSMELSGVWIAPIGTPPPEPGQPLGPPWEALTGVTGGRIEYVDEIKDMGRAEFDRIAARLAELQRRGALDDPTGQALGDTRHAQIRYTANGVFTETGPDEWADVTPHGYDPRKLSYLDDDPRPGMARSRTYDERRTPHRAHRIDSSENGPLGSPAPPRLPLDDQPIGERYPLPAPEDRRRLDAELAEHNDRQADAMRQYNQRRRPRLRLGPPTVIPINQPAPLDDQPDPE